MPTYGVIWGTVARQLSRNRPGGQIAPDWPCFSPGLGETHSANMDGRLILGSNCILSCPAPHAGFG